MKKHAYSSGCTSLLSTVDEVPKLGKVGRNIVIIQIVTSVGPDGRRGSAVVVADARVERPAVVTGIVPVNGLESHAARSVFPIISFGIRGVDDLTCARAVLITAENERVAIRVSDVRSASGNRGCFLGKNAT